MKIWLLAAAALLATACGQEHGTPELAPCAGVEINGEQYWEAKKGEAQWCADLAAAYTTQADVGRGAIDVNEDECTASFVFENEDTSVSGRCDVDIAGGADCNVHVVSGELTCVMTLRVMP